MKQKNRSMIGVLAAVILVAVGGYLLWQNSDEPVTEAQEAPVEKVDVLVAATDIKRGVSASDMATNLFAYARVAQLPAEDVRPNMITSQNDLAELGLRGNFTGIFIPANTPLTVEQFAVPGTLDTSALDDVPENLFQVTLAIAPERALGGRLFAGDHVAVLGSFDSGDGSPAQTVVVLDRVLVTDVSAEQPITQAQINSDPFAQGVVPTSRRFVTFGVPVDQLERLTWAAEYGRIWLAYQGDEAVVDDSAVRERSDVVVTLSDLAAQAEEAEQQADDADTAADGAAAADESDTGAG